MSFANMSVKGTPKASTMDASNMENFKPFPKFSTDVLHVGQEPEQWNSMAVVPPISLASTFKQFAPAEHTGFEYSRSGNPTRNCLEKSLAASEGAKHGHSDVIMGALCLNDDEMAERLRFFQNSLGAVPSPFDCYLVNRGLKTLAVRMKEHMKNGLAVAKFLESHPAVAKVIHPGLPSHPQYELGKRQMIGYSGMLTFFIKGGLAESRVFLKTVKLFTLAESLGGFESLCELPSLQTHASVPDDQRRSLGITDSLIRLSVGIEDVEDLIEDLDKALHAAVSILRFFNYVFHIL
ncbi:cystathionine gamma-lyase [Plakobranchus ocellatus]|uniref:cystathionine gamma-lyase n=1 Tax=Plakobranchus ocellatus TaxID=259542 RepID=A0AAV3Y804_9GAST|nr:cystathionine gamma-lyase [Plakobranchus ocellatus]